MPSFESVAWYEDAMLRRKAVIGMAGLAFSVKSVVLLLKTGEFSTEGFIDAVFGVGMLVDVAIEIVNRMKRGRDYDDPAAHVIPKLTPAGVEEYRAGE